MKVLIAHLYAKLWARKHGCKYEKARGIAKGLMIVPTGARFTFTLVHNGKLDVPGLARQLDYQFQVATGGGHDFRYDPKVLDRFKLK